MSSVDRIIRWATVPVALVLAGGLTSCTGGSGSDEQGSQTAGSAAGRFPAEELRDVEPPVTCERPPGDSGRPSPAELLITANDEVWTVPTRMSGRPDRIAIWRCPYGPVSYDVLALYATPQEAAATLDLRSVSESDPEVYVTTSNGSTVTVSWRTGLEESDSIVHWAGTLSQADGRLTMTIEESGTSEW